MDKVIQVLEILSKDKLVMDAVIEYLNEGMHDEWDCSLPFALENGWAGEELAIAAKSGLFLAEYDRRNLED